MARSALQTVQVVVHSCIIVRRSVRKAYFGLRLRDLDFPKALTELKSRAPAVSHVDQQIKYPQQRLAQLRRHRRCHDSAKLAVTQGVISLGLRRRTKG
jgi:hypothetical protein